jgi:hypothetical protein
MSADAADAAGRLSSALRRWPEPRTLLVGLVGLAFAFPERRYRLDHLSLMDCRPLASFTVAIRIGQGVGAGTTHAARLGALARRWFVADCRTVAEVASHVDLAALAEGRDYPCSSRRPCSQGAIRRGKLYERVGDRLPNWSNAAT